MTTATASVMRSPLPPRVPGLPLLGSLLDFRRDRIGMQLRIARDQGAIARVRLGLFPLLMVSAPDVAREVLVEKADAFVKSVGLSLFARPVLGNGLVTSEHGVHKRQRRMLAPVFAHKRIAAFGDVMADRTARAALALDDAALKGETVDLAEVMMRLTLDIVGKTLFDAEMAGHAAPIGEAITLAMRQMMRSMVRFVPLPPVVPTPGNLRVRRAVAGLDRIVYGMIRERRASAHDPGDMLSMLLATRDADDGSALSDLEVRDQAMTILLAGHETTAAALAWTFYLLDKHPDVRARVEAELDAVLGERDATAADLASLPFTLQALKESMRLYPPVYMLGRKATRDVEVGGVKVAQGGTVLVNISGIHRNPVTFPDPERFDPSRFAPEREKQLPPLAYLPFGAGPRVCIGNQFALMEGHLVLANLARRFRFERTSHEELVGEPLVTLRPRGGVAVKVVRRASGGQPVASTGA